jgi:hypothetical protein
MEKIIEIRTGIKESESKRTTKRNNKELIVYKEKTTMKCLSQSNLLPKREQN